MMYAEINFSVCVWLGVGGEGGFPIWSQLSFLSLFRNLPLWNWILLANNMIHFPSLILPPSMVSKNVPPYLVSDLIRDPFSAKAENKHTGPSIVPRFQLTTERSHGLLTVLFCPTIFLFFLIKYLLFRLHLLFPPSIAPFHPL